MISRVELRRNVEEDFTVGSSKKVGLTLICDMTSVCQMKSTL